ncbi:MAG TPA: Rv0909 family putative TA system antitoxin [Marmoricola sp.]|nr:Rv0909 family putative TA system antitoxin [Marmoricola sp.]
MTITETLKKKVDELELERRFNEIAEQTERVFKTAVEKAGDLAHDKRADIDGLLDKVEGALNQRTEGKYADKVTKVKTNLQTGVDKLAEKRPTV